MAKKKAKKGPGGRPGRGTERSDATKDAITASYEVKPPKPTQAQAIVDLADRTHDKRAATAAARPQSVPGRPGEYVQDFGSVGGIVDRIAGRRNAKDQSEGVY